MVNGEVVSGKLDVQAGVDQFFDLSGSERIHLDEFDKTILTDEIVQALGIDRKDVVLYREYPDRVNVLLRDGRKVVYKK